MIETTFEFEAECVTTLLERRLTGQIVARYPLEATIRAIDKFKREFAQEPTGVSVRLVPIDIHTWLGQRP